MLPFPNQYCDLTPTDKQRAFLNLEGLEAFFGGAAGGGKSVALLMGALQFVHVPGYAALIVRKDTQRLSLAGGLIPRSHEWLASAVRGKQARWSEARRTWTFPHDKGPPATISFGYLNTPQAKFRYQSSEYQYIAFDELTELAEADYLFLFSRLRKTKNLNVPLRMRSASNPGNIGHAWVKQRFIGEWMPGEPLPEGMTEENGVIKFEDRAFLPSLIADNKFLDGEEYRTSLLHLPPIERERLLNGDWNVQERGLIRLEWLRYYVVQSPGHQSPDEQSPDEQSPDHWSGCITSPAAVAATQSVAPRPMVGALKLDLLLPDGRSLAQVDPARCRRFITVDPAGTSADRAREARGRPPSHTVAQVWEQPRGTLSHLLILRHQVRDLLGFDQIVAVLEQLNRDWRPERIWIENEKLGRAALDQLHHCLPIDVVPTGGKDKATRASTLILKFSRGEIFLPKYETAWRPGFEAELLTWTGSDRQPTDQIDAAAYAAIISQTAAPSILAIEHIHRA